MTHSMTSRLSVDAPRGDGRPPIPSQLSTFSLYSMPAAETADSIAARRALMSRKGLSVEEVNRRAWERRQKTRRISRFDRHAAILAGLALTGLVLAWAGSARESQTALLTGYGVIGIAAVALIAYLTRMPAAARQPLEHYYLPGEQLATAEDIALLRKLVDNDAELEAIVSAWWRSPAPIRKADIRLALDLQHAKLG